MAETMWNTLDGCEVWTDALGERFGERVCVGIVGKKCVKDGVKFSPSEAEKKGIIDDYFIQEWGTMDGRKIAEMEGFILGTCCVCGTKCDEKKCLCDKCNKE